MLIQCPTLQVRFNTRSSQVSGLLKLVIKCKHLGMLTRYLVGTLQSDVPQLGTSLQQPSIASIRVTSQGERHVPAMIEALNSVKATSSTLRFLKDQ